MSVIHIAADLLDQGPKPGDGQAEALAPPSDLELDLDGRVAEIAEAAPAAKRRVGAKSGLNDEQAWMR